MTKKRERVGSLWVNYKEDEKGHLTISNFKGEINGVKVVGWLNDKRIVKDTEGRPVKDPATGRYLEEPLMRYDKATGQQKPAKVINIYVDDDAGAVGNTGKGFKNGFKKKVDDDTPF